MLYPAIQVFDDIDCSGSGKGNAEVNEHELRKWREAKLNEIRKSTSMLNEAAKELHQTVFVYYSTNMKPPRYEFSHREKEESEHYVLLVDGLEVPDQDGAKWAVFQPGVSGFERFRQRKPPHGHWIVLDDDHADNMDVLSPFHLRMIYWLLHRYFKMKLDRDDHKQEEHREDIHFIGHHWYYTCVIQVFR